MPDDNSKNQDDHWRRLAEELGLPFDEPAPAPVREPSPPPEPVAKVRLAEPADFLDESALPSPAWPDPALETGEAEARNRVRLEPVTPPEAGDDEGKPRRGRRRRGRGRGERRPAADEAAIGRPESPVAPASDIAAELTDDEVSPADAAAEEAGEAGAGDPQGPRKRRRRRRRRKPDEASVPAGPETPRTAVKPAPTQPVAEEFDDEEEEENDVEDSGENGQPQGGMDADDDEPEEDFSDWNVPSWNDLIASLYRPDRRE
jgi:ribonuclease E